MRELLGNYSILLTADTYTSVLPDAAHAAAENVADLIIGAGCLVPAPAGAGARPSEHPAGRARTLDAASQGR